MSDPGSKSADATSKISARRFAESHIPGNVTPGRDPEISRPGSGNPRSGVGCQIFPDPGPDREISGKVTPWPESGRIPEFPVRTGNFGKSTKSWGVAGISGKPRSGPGSGRNPGNSRETPVPGGIREFPGNPAREGPEPQFRPGTGNSRETPSGRVRNPGFGREPGIPGSGPKLGRKRSRNPETRPESGPGTPKLGRKRYFSAWKRENVLILRVSRPKSSLETAEKYRFRPSFGLETAWKREKVPLFVLKLRVGKWPKKCTFRH
jgi:hypothetical protein